MSFLVAAARRSSMSCRTALTWDTTETLFLVAFAFGKKEMRDVAKFLARLKVAPDLIVTSPLPRASQTAKIAAEYLKAKVREDELLAPGFGVSELRTVLKRHHSKVLILVGHEPDFTNIISGLTGASLKLSKAGVALLDIDPE